MRGPQGKLFHLTGAIFDTYPLSWTVGVGCSTPGVGKIGKIFFQISNFFDRFDFFLVCNCLKSPHMPYIEIFWMLFDISKCLCLLCQQLWDFRKYFQNRFQRPLGPFWCMIITLRPNLSKNLKISKIFFLILTTHLGVGHPPKIALAIPISFPWGPRMPNFKSLLYSVWAVRGDGGYEKAIEHLLNWRNLYIRHPAVKRFPKISDSELAMSA